MRIFSVKINSFSTPLKEDTVAYINGRNQVVIGTYKTKGSQFEKEKELSPRSFVGRKFKAGYDGEKFNAYVDSLHDKTSVSERSAMDEENRYSDFENDFSELSNVFSELSSFSSPTEISDRQFVSLKKKLQAKIENLKRKYKGVDRERERMNRQNDISRKSLEQQSKGTWFLFKRGSQQYVSKYIPFDKPVPKIDPELKKFYNITEKHGDPAVYNYLRDQGKIKVLRSCFED